MTTILKVPPLAPQEWERCDRCQAPLDDGQRFCVQCGTRRSQADDPAVRYITQLTRRARAATGRPATGGGSARSGSRLAIGAVFALLPLAAGLGVLVGRSGSDDQQKLIDALRAQKAPVVTVVAGAGGTSSAKATKKAAAKDNGSGHKKVLRKTKYGSARQLTGSQVSQKDLEESKKAIDHIVNSKGKVYVEQQRNLPDQIVVP